MTEQKQVLIIDDDPQNNLLTKSALKRHLGEVKVKDFTVPEEGLKHIQVEHSHGDENIKTILLLDINMPTMTGWEFLDKFIMFSDSVKKQFEIYILSSSVDSRDIDRAKSNPLIIDFIEKPLNKNKLERFF